MTNINLSSKLRIFAGARHCDTISARGHAALNGVFGSLQQCLGGVFGGHDGGAQRDRKEQLIAPPISFRRTLPPADSLAVPARGQEVPIPPNRDKSPSIRV